MVVAPVGLSGEQRVDDSSDVAPDAPYGVIAPQWRNVEPDEKPHWPSSQRHASYRAAAVRPPRGSEYGAQQRRTATAGRCGAARPCYQGADERAVEIQKERDDRSVGPLLGLERLGRQSHDVFDQECLPKSGVRACVPKAVAAELADAPGDSRKFSLSTAMQKPTGHAASLHNAPMTEGIGVPSHPTPARVESAVSRRRSR